MKPNEIHISPDNTLYHVGPPLDMGPLPSFFYFSLSGSDSLTLDPFNQPIQFLNGEMIRCFSMTLPGHEPPLDAKDALKVWADDFAKGQDPIAQFLTKVELAIEFAIKNQFVDPEKMAVGGLSRGALIALHIAARVPKIKLVLGFAPLTDLSKAEELVHLNDSPYNAFNIADKLDHQNIQLYIGNNDARVSTKSCFSFVMDVVEKAKNKNTRLEIYPSIGHKGHGTPPEIFQKGVNLIKECFR